MSAIGGTKSSAARMSCDTSDCILANTDTFGDQGHFVLNRNRILPDQAAGPDGLDASDIATAVEDHCVERVTPDNILCTTLDLASPPITRGQATSIVSLICWENCA